MRYAVVVVLAVALVLGLGVACGGSGGGIDLSDADEVMAGALRAVSPPGQVGHLKWEVSAEKVGTPLAEAWIDADNGRFRIEHRSVEDEEGSFTVAVGEKWRTATYLAAGDDSSPFPVYIATVDREEMEARGMDNLAYIGAQYLSSLLWADERRMIGESTADGREVVVLEVKQATGEYQGEAFFVATVELDKSTLLPVGFRSRTVGPDGAETGVSSMAQFEWEALSPDDLPADFFSPDALFATHSTAREKLAEASERGFELYWLGEKHEGAEELDLYLWDVYAESEDWPQLHYASEAMGGPEAVSIREGPTGEAEFGPGSEVVGPIEQEEVMVAGQPATLYSSSEAMSETIYLWLVFTRGETVIELHAMPVVGVEGETNPFNNTETLIALAEDLVPVPDDEP